MCPACPLKAAAVHIHESAYVVDAQIFIIIALQKIEETTHGVIGDLITKRLFGLRGHRRLKYIHAEAMDDQQ